MWRLRTEASTSARTERYRKMVEEVASGGREVYRGPQH